RQRLDATGCEHGHSRKKLRQIVGCIAVKAEPCAARKPGNFFEGACRERVITFLKDEDGDALQAKLTGLCGKIVHLLLHRVADEDKRVDLAACVFLQRMCKHLADLRVTATAVDLGHQFFESAGIVHEPRGSAFAEAAVIDQLNLQTACLADCVEHARLDFARHVPGGLTAHGGIKCQDQPPLPRTVRCKGACLLHEGVNRAAVGTGLGDVALPGLDRYWFSAHPMKMCAEACGDKP